jgi:hypothetical protein
MHVLHLTFYNSHTTLSDPLTTQNWITVLELAAPGGNPNIRDQTIHHLTIVTIKDPILCPYFAWFENVPSWFVPAVSVLARRAELLTKRDVTGTQGIHPDRLMALNPWDTRGSRKRPALGRDTMPRYQCAAGADLSETWLCRVHPLPLLAQDGG